MESKYKTLFGVALYKATYSQLKELEKKYGDEFEDLMPKYFVGKNGAVEDIINYAIILDNDDLESYYVFDYKTSDEILEKEIGNAGIEDFFNGNDLRPFFDKLQTYNIEKYCIKALPVLQYLVIQVSYLSSYDYYAGGYEYDVFINVDGILDITDTNNKLIEEW